MNVEIKILNPSAMLPHYATTGSAGLDLRAMLDEEFIVIKPDETVLIPTGIAININNPSYAAVLLPRSSLGHKSGLVLGNLVGLIDSDYQGEVFISLWNRSSQQRRIDNQDRIAQMVFIPVAQVSFVEVSSFEETSRGTGGFGSTGSS